MAYNHTGLRYKGMYYLGAMTKKPELGTYNLSLAAIFWQTTAISIFLAATQTKAAKMLTNIENGGPVW